MAEYTLYTNPMSRGQIARWALHEADADYDQVLVDWEDKGDLLRLNPMGKVPTVVHHHGGHDHVITETAAIRHYLAELSAPALLPQTHEKADYFRWLLFAAGPLEQAVVTRAMGWEVPPEREGMAGFGNFDRTIDALDGWLASHDYVCGGRFTMADVYVGSAVDWGLQFGSIPTRGSFEGYAGRFREREAYQASKAIDGELIAQMQAAS
ncbi:glutathione S-transferase family protein [Parafrankia sp. BMG5.11]|uniref:glutathione S-transferase family protein n=1 Tax=Parafrankia sp. BMG5.11 TaxID=222540 RepID=UPI00103967BE|nr:glutathione S-transferase family protein [Parafrankia sp. BMG5.11]TCJ38187.1 glutathione S-transferase family protein [Parafrankia sp. BMG5.11]